MILSLKNTMASTDWISSTKQAWEKSPAVLAKLDALQAAFGGFEIVGLDTSTIPEPDLISLLDGMLGINAGVLPQMSSMPEHNLKTINTMIYDLIDELTEMNLLGDPTERFITMLTICRGDLAGADAIWDSLNTSFDTETAACICSFYNMAFRSKDAACLCNPKHPLFHG